ncbi:MAG: hypothetical protein H7296_15450 [Bacteroidia bacterium]|nr:hypothetical protein [Bacteroidia bacterium]
MKKIFIILLIANLFTMACEEPVPHILFDEKDSVVKVEPKFSSDTYDGAIPGLDAQVIDYTLENEYQHKPQLLRDSTWSMSWDNAGFPNAKKFVIFFKSFQWDVMDRNREKIAGMIKFPLRDYPKKQDFIRRFDSIFGPDFVQEILDQDPKGIFRSKSGAMIGDDGQIWFKQINGNYKIIEINP